MARDETVKATLGASSTGEWTMSFRSADRHTHTYDQAPSRRLGHVAAMPFSALLYVSMQFLLTGTGLKEVASYSGDAQWIVR